MSVIQNRSAPKTHSRATCQASRDKAELEPLVDKVWRYCDHTGVRGRTVTLKVKFADFQVITRSHTGLSPLPDRSALATIRADLLAAQFPMPKSVRLIRVSLSSLCADLREDEPKMLLAL